MRDALTLLNGRLGRANVKTAIDMGRIAGQDFAAELPGKPNAQRSLSRSGRPHDGDQRKRRRPGLARTIFGFRGCFLSWFWGGAHRRNFQ